MTIAIKRGKTRRAKMALKGKFYFFFKVKQPTEIS